MYFEPDRAGKSSNLFFFSFAKNGINEVSFIHESGLSNTWKGDDSLM